MFSQLPSQGQHERLQSPNSQASKHELSSPATAQRTLERPSVQKAVHRVQRDQWGRTGFLHTGGGDSFGRVLQALRHPRRHTCYWQGNARQELVQTLQRLRRDWRQEHHPDRRGHRLQQSQVRKVTKAWGGTFCFRVILWPTEQNTFTCNKMKICSVIVYNYQWSHCWYRLNVVNWFFVSLVFSTAASELGQTCWCGSATTCLYSHCLMVEQNCYVGSDDNRFDYFGLRNVKITPPDPTVFPHCGPVQNIG